MSMKTYDEISSSMFVTGNLANNTNATKRLNPVPIDSSSIYKTFADASNYALNGGVAYEGQIIAVTEDGKQVAYVLDSSSTTGLRRIGNDPIEVSSQISAIAGAYALSTIQGLNIAEGSALSAATGKMVNKIWEENGIVKVAYRDLVIAEVNGLQAALDGKQAAGNYLSAGVAKDPTASDWLLKKSEVEAKINALDATISTLLGSETIKSIQETDGIIAIEKQSIQIAETQVEGLTTDLSLIRDDIKYLGKVSADYADVSADHESRLTAAEGDIDVLEGEVDYLGSISGNLSSRLYTAEQSILSDRVAISEIKTDYLKNADFASLSNDIGLSAATADNVVVTKKDIDDLGKALVFRGTTSSDISTGLSVIPEGTGYYDTTKTPPVVPKAGDLVINTNTAREYVWVGEDWKASGTTGRWVELGDEKQYLSKTEFASLSNNWLTGTFDPFKSAVELSIANLSTYGYGISTDLNTEIQARKSNDSYLSGRIDGLSGESGYALSADVKSISGSLYDKITSAIADEETARKNNDSFISGRVDALSNEVSAISSSINSEIAAEVAARDAADSFLSGKIDTVSADLDTLENKAVLSVKLNGEWFTVQDNVAEITLSSINCGDADTE